MSAKLFLSMTESANLSAVSMHSASTPLGTLLSGTLMDRLGRNRALQVATPLMVAGWAVLGLAQNHAMVLAARAMCGAAVGIVAAPAQVGPEVSQAIA